MAKDKRDLLTVLQAELEFLEKGGYQHASRAPWRPQFIFEDSATCINHGRTEKPLPCSECALIDFVPTDCRGERIPCRHIPLNSQGFTIDTYYRLGTQEEVEAAVAGWLRTNIERLQRERGQEAAVPGEVTVTSAAGA